MRKPASSSRRRRLLLRNAEQTQEAGSPELGEETAYVPQRSDPGVVADEPPATIPLRVSDVNQPWRSELRRLLDGMQPLTWVFTGDGVTQAARHTDGRRGYVELFDARIRGGLRRLLDVVVNTALEGGRLATLQRNREWRVDRFKPDVVSLMVGFTDSAAGKSGREAFRGHLHEMVEQLVEEGVVVVLNTPHRPSAAAAGQQADLPDYVRIVREVADETGVLLVDHWAHWKQARGASVLAADGLHPSATGHAEIARLLQRELGVDGP